MGQIGRQASHTIFIKNPFIMKGIIPQLQNEQYMLESSMGRQSKIRKLQRESMMHSCHKKTQLESMDGDIGDDFLEFQEWWTMIDGSESSSVIKQDTKQMLNMKVNSLLKQFEEPLTSSSQPFQTLNWHQLAYGQRPRSYSPIFLMLDICRIKLMQYDSSRHKIGSQEPRFKKLLFDFLSEND